MLIYIFLNITQLDDLETQSMFGTDSQFLSRIKDKFPTTGRKLIIYLSQKLTTAVTQIKTHFSNKVACSCQTLKVLG